jgi:hypothetical protein
VWLAFFLFAGALWASGAWLFVHSALTPLRKIVWTLFLLAAGMAIGAFLSMEAIRIRFLIVLAILPVLAVVDVTLARSNRTLAFWLRACGFEVCTVFGAAALIRLLLR